VEERLIILLDAGVLRYHGLSDDTVRERLHYHRVRTDGYFLFSWVVLWSSVFSSTAVARGSCLLFKWTMW